MGKMLKVGLFAISVGMGLAGCGDNLVPECAQGEVTFLRDCDGEWGGEATCTGVASQPVVGCLATKAYTPDVNYEFTCVDVCSRTNGP